MNDRRDNGSSNPGSPDAQSGTPAGGQPRKPRIEVLQRGPAAAPGPRFTQGADTAGIGASSSAAPAASAHSSWTADQPRQIETPPAPRRRGLSRSPTTLLILLACIVIAGFLLYTYLSSERGAEYPEKATQLSPQDAELLGDPQTDSGPATTEEPSEPPAAESIDDGAVPEAGPAASPASEPASEPAPQPAPRPAPPRAAAPEAQPEVVDRPEAPPADKSEAEAEADAADAVQAFYSALSAGDGASAARLVIPAKRGSGPLSAGALTRYYSSFRRPLRLRRIVPVNADTVRVVYDYVLADGRVCRGQAAVDVVHRGGRSLVSGIRTRGPC
ncbi:MAG TPA: hypothetical protein VF650_01535 [Allosphingosinicella sp.]|jgi:hypothetical protein